MTSLLHRLLQGPTGAWLWLLAPLFMASAPHFTRTPPWLGPVCVGLWLLRLVSVGRPRLVPGRPIRLFLTLLGIAVVYASYGYLLGPEPGTALLLLLLALKPLESGGYRDQLVIVLMTYLVILLHFLVSQSLPAAAYMSLAVLVNTAALLGLVHDQSRGDPRFRLARAGALLLQALPVMLLLFVLFPRLPGSLWGLMQKPETASTGLSETMNPGDVSRLLQSSEVVFRVSFDASLPPVSSMYWRVLVLWETDGRTWRIGVSDDSDEEEDWGVVPVAEATRYVLTMEAHGQTWLPVLEMPLAMPDRVQPGPDARVLLPEPLRQRAQFPMASALVYRLGALSVTERERALALPEEGNARSRSKALAWRERLSDDQAVVEAALGMFRDDLFVYTLSPPLLGRDAVDDFLFGTRSGYCEHYASAFTFLMRAAGVPARVVLGFQGGDRNPLGDYYVVREYHAHAWSEVWLEGRGWVRVDPTNVLAPDRIEVGAGALVPDIGVPRVLSSREIGWAINLWRNLTMGWDAANALWNQWVLDFGFERQKRFFERLGLGQASRLERFGYLFLGLAAFCLAAALAYAVILLGSRPRKDSADRLYALFCKRLARAGVVRRANEGPRDFALRAARLRPDLAEMIVAVSNAYMQQRYGIEAQGSRDDRLGRLVRSFRPGTAPESPGPAA